MGHDIFGHRNENDEQEIAYLRRGAFNQAAREIYRALDCTDLDGGCSGIGEGRHFTRDQLVAAVKSLPPSDELQPEVTFLWDCINKGGDQGAFIYFG